MPKENTVINPYNNEVVVQYNFDSLDKVMSSLNYLKEGRAEQLSLSQFQRAEILNRLADLLSENSSKFEKLLVSEIGKTVQDAQVEIKRSISTVRISAQEATRIEGEVIQSDSFGLTANKKAIVEFRPVGTVLAITPFNFPINLALHKIGPAFAAGNTILFKPHEQNYLSGKLLVDLCYQAGMTEGMIQFCMPEVKDMKDIISNKNVSLVSLTGGIQTAQAIAKSVGVKKYLCELGGNDPLILFPDGDIEGAIKATINQRFATAGQRCTAAKRLFIHEDIFETFKEQLIEKTCLINVGNPSLEHTLVGPLVNKNAADTVMDRINDAIERGASVLCGHERVGNVIYPTILENVSEESTLIKDETFGPVVPLFKFNDIEEVIEKINSTDFGLQAGVFTKDLNIIQKLYNNLEVGALIVGDGPGFRAEHFPFGGVKDSGIGSEGIKYAIREMSTKKSLVL
ncbi:MAG: aldehyde dehydrogenase family protein [Bacteriovoracaceae bacterium]|nr:aldehyde dehydrogenase family protein [Bacteriovoracaceae bacterium]